MYKILPMLLIAAIVVLIFTLSYIREKRVQKFTDEFCKAFMEASDHILNIPLNDEKLKYSIDASITADNKGKAKARKTTVFVKLAPLEEQPEALRKLFEKGIDDYVLDRFKTMHIKRDGAQQYLTSINMIEKKYNAAMNRIYDIANISFSALDDFNVIKTQEDVDDFHFFLHHQDFIRNTTLASIMSRDRRG